MDMWKAMLLLVTALLLVVLLVHVLHWWVCHCADERWRQRGGWHLEPNSSLVGTSGVDLFL